MRMKKLALVKFMLYSQYGLLEAFLHGSVFDKTPFCLEEKQGMFVNQFGIGEEKIK